MKHDYINKDWQLEVEARKPKVLRRRLIMLIFLIIVVAVIAVVVTAVARTRSRKPGAKRSIWAIMASVASPWYPAGTWA